MFSFAGDCCGVIVMLVFLVLWFICLAGAGQVDADDGEGVLVEVAGFDAEAEVEEFVEGVARRYVEGFQEVGFAQDDDFQFGLEVSNLEL